MKYFIDTEFGETGDRACPTIDLISIAIVCDDGREYYAESSDFEATNSNEFVDFYVLPRLLLGDETKTNSVIANEIIDFIGTDTDPEFWAYYGDYDWVVFCWLYGTMMSLPEHFPKFCMDLQQWWVQLGRPDVLPKKDNMPHNALIDARWNRDFWKALDDFSKPKVSKGGLKFF